MKTAITKVKITALTYKDSNLRKVALRTPKIKIHILKSTPTELSNKSMLGGACYIPKTNEIVCVASILNSKILLRKAILHELLHAVDATVSTMRHDSKKIMWWDISEMRAQAAELSDDLVNCYNSLVFNNSKSDEDRIIKLLLEGYNIKSLHSESIKLRYGVRKLHDF